MPLSRLLAIALLVFPLTASGQASSNSGSNPQHAPYAITPSEPWRILPSDPSRQLSPNDQRNQLQTYLSETLKGQHQGILEPPNVNSDFIASPGGGMLESYCLKIRSYVVARDSKDSDSTHFVGYSTCQPASRYRLETIQLQAAPPSR